MKYLVRSDALLTDVAFLLVRVCVGAVFLAHGWDAVVNRGVAEMVPGHREMGIPLPELSAPFLAYGELVGGVLLIVGAATRAAAVVLTVIMGGAWVFVHAEGGLMLANGGFEYVMVLAAICLLVLVHGPGRFSTDALAAGRFGAPVPERPTARA
ncbi:DoxX family protein [Streptomonospora sp. S1-112]|uniref:DoxX family protein n=1 Tax=Streptomonospora mangrovi TaxID=2883123 RepID=A0A9X3NRB8_9ACTN|nr:DoxX family protein [Streptomonospora mangrovi]MDA0566619.1 DoxX family protein [Streptomonospora mangrovi]